MRLLFIVKKIYFSYVSHLKIVAEDFRSCLSSLNVKANRPVIPDSTMNLIFLNIGEIYNLNKQLMTDLQERMDEWCVYRILLTICCNLSAFGFCVCLHDIVDTCRACMVMKATTCIDHDYYLMYRESKERIGDVVSSIAPFLKVLSILISNKTCTRKCYFLALFNVCCWI